MALTKGGIIATLTDYLGAYACGRYKGGLFFRTRENNYGYNIKEVWYDEDGEIHGVIESDDQYRDIFDFKSIEDLTNQLLDRYESIEDIDDY